MATAKKAVKKTLSNSSKSDPRIDLATKTATAVTEAITRSKKRGSNEEKIAIHIHIGDVVMMGFDEAIDAEEWGMRENNTEIIGGKPVKGKGHAEQNAEELANKDRKISRSINFRKGALELNALENSEPARKSTAKKATTKRAARTKISTRK